MSWLPTCYFTTHDSIIVGYPWVPCGPASGTGFVQCCALGDSCGADGFCHYTHSLTGGSGYYLAGCTDPTNKDSSCPTQCSSQGPDVVFSSSTNLWSCCYDKPLNCTSPTNITFKAASPEVLFASPFSIITATGTSTSTQGTATSTPTESSIAVQRVTVTATPTSSAGSSSGPSFGAGVGVGIGVSVGLAFIIGLGFLLAWLLRSHRRHRQQQQQQQIQEHQQQHQYYSTHIPTRSTTVWSPHETEMKERAAEMSNGFKNPTELPYNSTSAELA